jgi:hypothetical protein
MSGFSLLDALEAFRDRESSTQVASKRKRGDQSTTPQPIDGDTLKGEGGRLRPNAASHCQCVSSMPLTTGECLKCGKLLKSPSKQVSNGNMPSRRGLYAVATCNAALCEGCGATISVSDTPRVRGLRADRRFCSNSCRQRAYRLRRKAA